MLEPIIRQNAFGGKGEVTLRPLLTDEQKNEITVKNKKKLR